MIAMNVETEQFFETPQTYHSRTSTEKSAYVGLVRLPFASGPPDESRQTVGGIFANGKFGESRNFVLHFTVEEFC
jgi:hypothetical protein